MYKEFKIMYIGMAVLGVLMIINIILQIRILKDKPVAGIYAGAAGSAPAQPSVGSKVFCKNCATQFDASLKVCPKCGTPR